MTNAIRTLSAEEISAVAGAGFSCGCPTPAPAPAVPTNSITVTQSNTGTATATATCGNAVAFNEQSNNSVVLNQSSVKIGGH